MAVNYMERLAAMRGDRPHAAGAPVLHADEKSKRKKKRKPLSRKQKAALAKGRRVNAKMRSEKKMAKRKSKSSKRRSPRRRHKSTPEQRTRRLARFRAKHGVRRVRRSKRKDKSGAIAVYTVAPRRRRKRSKSRKAPKRHRKSGGGRKSAKHVRAGKKAARTRARHKAERAAARRRGGKRKKRSGHRRKRSHARKHHRAAPRRRRRRGGRARRRNRGMMRRNNRSGKFVGKGGRSRRSHVEHYGAKRKRGGYHRAGRIVREGYSMENPLDMGELATGLVTGLIGYIAADIGDRMVAGRGALGGLPAAESAPIYSDFMRLGLGLGLAVAPLFGAHFINGTKHRHIRAGLQFFGFGAGIRTLGHLVTDLVASQLKNNSMVGATVQALYPQEIIAAGQMDGAKAAGAGALPEDIGNAMRGLGGLPQGVAACCNNSSRLLNTALSPLQPIGRSAEMGGAAANFAPPPVSLPPPIERIVQQPYSPPSVTRQATPIPLTPVVPPPPGFTTQPTLPPARTTVVTTSPGSVAMQAAYAPEPALTSIVVPAGSGVNGLPSSPFAWGEEN